MSATSGYIAFLACVSCGRTEEVDALIDLNRATRANRDEPTALVTCDATGVRVARPPGG